LAISELPDGEVATVPVVNAALVNVAAAGTFPPITELLIVPPLIAGVVSDGLVPNTNNPEPVSSVTAAAKFALEGVPRNVATPAPKLVIPVPPLATANVPAKVTAPVVALFGVKPVVPALKLATPVAAAVSTYNLLAMSVLADGVVVIVPVVNATDVMSVFAPLAAALRLERAVEASVAPVPPFRTGKVPVTCVVRLTPDNVPPSVKFPEEVTVPVNVMPLTVPVPLTDVTVPAPATVSQANAAPSHLRNVSADTGASTKLVLLGEAW
jgi:hypothetical protein